jgi:hypothetical protein
MIRTQVQLTREQHVRLKRWADRLGISMAEAREEDHRTAFTFDPRFVEQGFEATPG